MKNECYAIRLGINAIIIIYNLKKTDQELLIFFKLNTPVV